MDNQSLYTYRNLIKHYDDLVKAGEPVCPIAHTYITCHVGVLISADGQFLFAAEPATKGELVAVPCTVKSDSRTSNIAPHLLHDQLCYVADYSHEYKKRHDAYIQQLKNYVSKCPNDLYAKAIYNYVLKNTLMDDIKHILKNIKNDLYPEHKRNILFCVYGMDIEGADNQWAEWYLSQLKPNGFCYVTGEPDYIPETYPRRVSSSDGMGIFFAKGCHVGYIASQKIIHTLRYMLYAKDNAERVAAESQLRKYFEGEIDAEKLIEWVNKKYPGKAKGLLKILRE